jgi:hypothetical protein
MQLRLASGKGMTARDVKGSCRMRAITRTFDGGGGGGGGGACCRRCRGGDVGGVRGIGEGGGCCGGGTGCPHCRIGWPIDSLCNMFQVPLKVCVDLNAGVYKLGQKVPLP